MSQVLVLPIIEYAVAVWGQGEWVEADQLQYEAAALILHTHPNTCKAALRGELGWHRMRARRDSLAVAYWCGLLPVNGAPPERYRSRLYRAERYDSQQRGRDAGQDTAVIAVQSEGRGASYHWSEYIHTSLIHHHLPQFWDEQHCIPGANTGPGASAGGAQVTSMVVAPRPVRRTRDYFTMTMVADWKKATQEDEQRQWRAELETLSSLSSYRLFKRRLELELYLQDEGSRMSVSGRCGARDGKAAMWHP
jgi:hypothetical protein